MTDLKKASQAIREEGLNGWLFLNFQHRDRIADLALDVPEEAVNTRPWAYLLLPNGDGVKIVHAVERSILDHLPGKKRVYVSRKELAAALKDSAPAGGRTAAQVSRNIAAISTLDQGHAELLKSCGFSLTTSAGLIQRTLGLIDEQALAGHQRASDALHEVVRRVWARIEAEMTRGGTIREGEVQDWILALLEEMNLVTEGRPIVAVGPNSGDPHYSPRGQGLPLTPEVVLQLDLWAREPAAGSVFADISWVGFLGTRVPEREQAVFAAVARAREAALGVIAGSQRSGQPLSGAAVDREARAVLAKAGYGDYIRHRTGHAIDTRIHGYGVNLDSVEFPDERPLLAGSCFSVEPGLYLPEFGMRTEINVVMRESGPQVTGPGRQSELLRFRPQGA